MKFLKCNFETALCKGEITQRPSRKNKGYCEFHADIFDAIELVLKEKKQGKPKVVK